MAERVTLVLSGGNALGAYHGGAYETLQDEGLQPERIVGASIGAVNAAIVAGNPPGQRADKLRQFWQEAARNGAAWAFETPFWGDERVRALQSSILGSPAVFRPRFPGALSLLPGMPGDASLYDLGPLRATLERVVDFRRLNGAEPSVTVVATDMLTGEEVRFDTRQAPIGPDHLLASCGFPPFFPPLEIDGRLLCDGGMAANLPIEAALEEEAREDRLCIAVDLFCRQGERPRTVGQAVDRQLDLLLSSQTARAVASLRRLHELRRHLRTVAQRVPANVKEDAEVAWALSEGESGPDGATTLVLLAHTAVPSDVEMRAFDFSRAVLAQCWEAGRSGMRRVLRELGSRRAAPGGFVVHALTG
jgi:NTE family protein